MSAESPVNSPSMARKAAESMAASMSGSRSLKLARVISMAPELGLDRGVSSWTGLTVHRGWTARFSCVLHGKH